MIDEIEKATEADIQRVSLVVKDENGNLKDERRPFKQRRRSTGNYQTCPGIQPQQKAGK